MRSSREKGKLSKGVGGLFKGKREQGKVGEKSKEAMGRRGTHICSGRIPLGAEVCSLGARGVDPGGGSRLCVETRSREVEPQKGLTTGGGG